MRMIQKIPMYIIVLGSLPVLPLGMDKNGVLNSKKKSMNKAIKAVFSFVCIIFNLLEVRSYSYGISDLELLLLL